MKTQNSRVDFVQSVINILVGKTSWGVSSGIGSFLTLEFGKAQISNDGQKRGEFHLWIYGCAWRIEKEGRFIVGSQDKSEYISEIAVATLNDLLVTEIQVDPSNFDTTIKFEPNISLQTFSNSSDMEHWILYLPKEKTLTVGPEFTFKATKI